MIRCMIGVLLLSMSVMVSGCAGGGLVIGPISSLTASQNDRDRLQRAVIASSFVPDKREKIMRLSAVTSDVGAIGATLDVDVGQLIKGDYTWGEIFKQLMGSLGDAGVYTGLAYSVKKGLDKLKSDDDDEPEAAQSDLQIEIHRRGEDIDIKVRSNR